MFRKIILTHESGSQEDQFDEKNGGKKSRDTIPLNKVRRLAQDGETMPNHFLSLS
jgi:hypothetical protein